MLENSDVVLLNIVDFIKLNKIYLTTHDKSYIVDKIKLYNRSTDISIGFDKHRMDSWVQIAETGWCSDTNDVKYYSYREILIILRTHKINNVLNE